MRSLIGARKSGSPEVLGEVRKSGSPEVRKSWCAFVLLLIGGVLLAAEPVVGAPTPAGEVDPVTQRRAAEMLAEMATAEGAEPAGPVDAVLAERMAGIEGWLREIALLLDKNEPAAAGERFLLASEALRALEADQRAALGRRYLLARDRLQGFARTFADDTE